MATVDHSEYPAQAGAAASDGLERRSRLRHYQTQLLDKVQAARTSTAAGSKALGLVIGERRCLIDLTQVGEIVPLSEVGVTRVPMTQDWYRGLVNIRGNLTGVIDLARYRGEAAGPSGADNRLVTFGAGLEGWNADDAAPDAGGRMQTQGRAETAQAFNCALLVARVLGLRDLDDMTPLDGAADGAPDWLIGQFTDKESLHWHQIDLALLVRDPRFLQVGA
jgi:twitching motility protein PilI